LARASWVSSIEEALMAKDPVCGMMVDEKTAAGKSEYQGQTYYFCAMVCKRKFDANPANYANKDR
jgi:Cu+-exporting ATPase